MVQQVIRIGPRGGRIVAEGTGGKGPQYEGHGGGEGYGLPRRPALERPTQADLFAGQPRTLALTSPEAPRARRAAGAEQGSLFGPVATAPPRPATALPSWAKPRGASSAAAKLEAQTSERKPPAETKREPSGNAVVDRLRARTAAFAAIGKGPEIRSPESYKTAADAIEAYEAHNKHAATMRDLEDVGDRDLFDAKNRDAKVHGDHAHELYRRVVELQSQEDAPAAAPSPAAKLERQTAEREAKAPDHIETRIYTDGDKIAKIESGEPPAHQGRADYQERREARIERLHGRAESKASEAESRMAAFHGIHEHIPMGQPILVGHHSEGRHRRDLARADAHVSAALKAQTESRKLERRAHAAETNTAVSSDDPEAVVKLKEQIAAAEKTQETYRALNKIVKAKGLTPDQKVAKLVSEHGVKEATARRFLEPDELGRIGVPDYMMSNHSANIRRMKQRVEQLGKTAAKPSLETAYGDVRVHDNADANRVQLHFPGKPDDATRAELKAHGFRWAPSEGAWQRQRSEGALHHAHRLAEKFGGPKE